MPDCKICNGPTEKIFSKVILKKYPADYYRCKRCGFVQTSDPAWLSEAYSSAITSLDIGLISRNIKYSQEVADMIDACLPEAKVMLDYAGGYGMFVRLMRDLGFDFYREDIYCENIFAKNFDISDSAVKKYDVVTAFEVFEHFVKPLEEIEKIFSYSDNVIFSTELLPATTKDTEDWWYISPETGQHVAFYTTDSMLVLAKKFGKNFYSKHRRLHMFTSKTLTQDQQDYAFGDIRERSSVYGLVKTPLNFKISRPSLLDKDYQYIKKMLEK